MRITHVAKCQKKKRQYQLCVSGDFSYSVSLARLTVDLGEASRKGQFCRAWAVLVQIECLSPTATTFLLT